MVRLKFAVDTGARCCRPVQLAWEWGCERDRGRSAAVARISARPATDAKRRIWDVTGLRDKPRTGRKRRPIDLGNSSDTLVDCPAPKRGRDFNPGRCRGRMTRSWRESTRHSSEPSNNDARTFETRDPRGDSEKEPAAVDRVRCRRHFQTKRIEMVTRISRVNSFWLVLSWALCRTFPRLTFPIGASSRNRTSCVARASSTGAPDRIKPDSIPARERDSVDRKSHLGPAGIAGLTPRGIKLLRTLGWPGSDEPCRFRGPACSRSAFPPDRVLG